MVCPHRSCMQAASAGIAQQATSKASATAVFTMTGPPIRESRASASIWCRGESAAPRRRRFPRAPTGPWVRVAETCSGRRIVMPFYERGPVRIHYQEVGSGFPLLLIPGGGLNSALSSWQTASPFNPMERYGNDFRCICADLRNANPGQSSGPLEIDRPWDAYTDDQLGLMDHLGIREFMVMGFCIGGPMIHNLIKRAPDRIVAAAMMQPSGFRPEIPDLFYQNNIKGWGPPLCEKRSDLTMEMVHRFLTSMYTNRADFVFTVSRDFVRSIKTPLLIAPDDVPAHPYKVAMEVAALAPNSEVTIYPWKDSQAHIDEVVEHARRFLKAHEPVGARR